MGVSCRLHGSVQCHSGRLEDWLAAPGDDRAWATDWISSMRLNRAWMAMLDRSKELMAALALAIIQGSKLRGRGGRGLVASKGVGGSDCRWRVVDEIALDWREPQ